jgi:hypothetical protein
MSAQAFNRISALEAKVRKLEEQVAALTTKIESQACEAERVPKTLTLKPKATPSHA